MFSPHRTKEGNKKVKYKTKLKTNFAVVNQSRSSLQVFKQRVVQKGINTFKNSEDYRCPLVAELGTTFKPPPQKKRTGQHYGHSTI